MRLSSIHNDATIAIGFKRLKVGSSIFRQEELIPNKYTCEGDIVIPLLNIGNFPKETKCLVLIVEDRVLPPYLE